MIRAGAGARVVALDLETTGTVPETDRVAELAILEPGKRPRVVRVSPGIPLAETLIEGACMQMLKTSNT